MSSAVLIILGFIVIIFWLFLVVEWAIRELSIKNWNIVMNNPEKIQEYIDACFDNTADTSYIIDNSDNSIEPKIIIKNWDKNGDQYIIFYKTALWISPLMTATTMLSDISYGKEYKKRVNWFKEAFENAKSKQ